MSTAPDVINLDEVVREREELENLIRYLARKLLKIKEVCHWFPDDAGHHAQLALDSLRKAGF